MAIPEELTIEEKRTGAEFELEKRVGDSHIPVAILEYGNGHAPVAINYENQRVPIEVRTVTMNAEKYFRHEVVRDQDGEVSAIRFASPAARKVFVALARTYISREVSGLMESHATELELAHFGKPGGYTSKSRERLDEKSVVNLKQDVANEWDVSESIIKELNRLIKRNAEPNPLYPMLAKDPKVAEYPSPFPYKEWAEDILEWIEALEENGTEITQTTTSCNIDGQRFSIRRITIGRASMEEQGTYRTEEKVLEKVLFARTTLGLRCPNNLDIIEAVDATPDLRGFSASGALKFVGTTGRHSSVHQTIFLVPLARLHLDDMEIGENGRLEASTRAVFKRRHFKNIDHETGHFVDDSLREATSAQAEAFAQGMEAGFSFNKARAQLRRDFELSQNISSDQIRYIFSNTDRHSTAAEVYGIAPTLYCWIFEKLGPDKMVEFHGLISGGRFSKEARFLSLAERQEAKKYFACNVDHCLEEIVRGEETEYATAKELFEDYIKDLNAPEDQGN